MKNDELMLKIEQIIDKFPDMIGRTIEKIEFSDTKFSIKTVECPIRFIFDRNLLSMSNEEIDDCYFLPNFEDIFK